MEEQTSEAVRTAASRILVPFLRVTCWTLSAVALVAVLVNQSYLNTRAVGWSVPAAVSLIRSGIIPISTGIGFIGLLVLPIWEKVALFALMLAVAWLSA